MHSRLGHLLLLLLDALENRDDDDAFTVGDLRELVRAAGLGDADLDDLMQWFAERRGDDPDLVWLAASRLHQPSERSLRQIGPGEDEALTIPAFGYLLGLVSMRQISAEQMETLIQHAQIAPGAPLAPADLEPLLDRVVFREDAISPDEAARPSSTGGQSRRIH